MGIEVKELLKPFLFQFKPVVQTHLDWNNHRFCASFISKNNIKNNSQQTQNTKALVQNITNQTNLNKVKIVLSKIWYLNHFKKHCLVLPLTKSDDFLVGVVSFYFRKVDRNDVEVTLKVKLTKTAHNDPWVFFVNVPWFCLRLQIKSAEKINSKICNLSPLKLNIFFSTLKKKGFLNHM